MPDQEAAYRVFIDDLKRGDEQAWEQLSPIVRSQARKYPRTVIMDADDLAQDALIRMQGAIGAFNPDGGRGTVQQNFFSWTHSILYNRSMTSIGRERRTIDLSNLVKGLQLPDDWGDQLASDPSAILTSLARRAGTPHGTENDPERSVALNEIIALINSLSTDRKRRAAGYYFLLGHTIKETAEFMHEDFDAINTLLMRDIKTELRRLAQQRGIDAQYLALWERPPMEQTPSVADDEASQAPTEGEEGADDEPPTDPEN